MPLRVLDGAPGFCDVTNSNTGTECRPSDQKGSWGAYDLHMCLAWCDACAQCRYVSFSKAHGDCSWFAKCPKLRGGKELKEYVGEHATYQVRFANGTRTRVVDFMRAARYTPPPRPLTGSQLLATDRWVRQLEPRDSHLVQVGANAHQHTSYRNDDPGPLCVQLGWRAFLIEPQPQVFGKLYATYPNASVVSHARKAAADGRASRVSLLQAAVCDGTCEQRSLLLYSIDLNKASNFGSDDADGRCLTMAPPNHAGRPTWEWLTEVASANPKEVLKYGIGQTHTPKLCAHCSKVLSRPLPTSCRSRVIEANLVATDVPCVCLGRAVRGFARRPKDTQVRPKGVVHLLAIDTEGWDGQVLESYPFGQVETWRVRFESDKLNKSTQLVAARERLAAHGFLPLQLGPELKMQDDVWHHPGSGK